MTGIAVGKIGLSPVEIDEHFTPNNPTRRNVAYSATADEAGLILVCYLGHTLWESDSLTLVVSPRAARLGSPNPQVHVLANLGFGHDNHRVRELNAVDGHQKIAAGSSFKVAVICPGLLEIHGLGIAPDSKSQIEVCNVVDNLKQH